MTISDPIKLLAQANALLDRGQLSQARELFANVCELDDSNAEAWLMLGAIDAEAGRLEDALKHTQKALTLDPAYEEAHLTLAGLQQGRGQLEDALESCARALSIDADYEEAWLMQSGIQGALRQYTDSEESSREALRLWPECVNAHVNLGNALKAQSQWDAAISCYQQALQLEPGQVEAAVNLGSVLLEQDRLLEAEDCFSGVLANSPANAWASLGMARLSLARNDPESAIEYSRNSISSDPKNISARLVLCECLVQASQLDEAANVCSAIPTRSEGDECAVAVMFARILERRGDNQQAFEMLRRMLEKHPDAPDLVLVFSDVSRHLKNTAVATRLLEDQLERQHPPGVRTQLHFSLGRLYDNDCRYNEAFRQFQQANSLKPAVFDPAGHTAVIKTLIEAYTPEMLATYPAAGNPSQIPVFIVGMPRAGSTLVEQILSSHSRVFGAGELPYIGQMAVALSGKINCGLPYPKCVHALPQALLDTLAENYLARLQEKSGTAVRVTDKQNGNFFHLGLIQLLFPHARVIHCMRDPLDTCLSLYSHDMVGEATYTRTFEGLACYYKNYERLMHHWHEVLSLPVLDVSYESLVLNQEQSTRNLLEFCGLEWEDQCLDFHENKRAVATPSHAQVRQPMYSSSIGRWRHYENEMSPLRVLLEG